MKNIRQSNFELLRIVSMFLIVMSHCDDIFGLYDLYSKSLGVYKIITDWLHIGGQIGVGCFILVSGYFMVEQKITSKKLLKLAGEVWFYTISIWLIWIISNIALDNPFDRVELFKQTLSAFFPILFSHYWFVTAYIILMILSPFLNKLIFSLDKKQYQTFLISILLIFVVLSGGFPKFFSGMMGGRLIPVIIMYFIAGYLRRFDDLKKKNSARHFLVALICYVLLFISCYFITFLGLKLNNEAILEERYFYRVLNSPLVVIISVELFIGFLRQDIKYSKIINALASCTFGVYLLHSNKILSSHLPKLFPIYKEQNAFLVFLYSIFSVLCIYFIASLIDFIRKNSVEKIWIYFLDKELDKVQKIILEKIMCLYTYIIKLLNNYYDK